MNYRALLDMSEASGSRVQKDLPARRCPTEHSAHTRRAPLPTGLLERYNAACASHHGPIRNPALI